jgi:hypothetical protein
MDALPTTRPSDIELTYSRFEAHALQSLDLRPGGQLCARNADRLMTYVNGLDLAGFFRTFSDEDVARMMLPRAYWHPAGFIRSQLFCGERDLPEVRLHYWKANTSVQFDEAVHEHPWDSISIVLRGTVRNEFWRIDTGEDCPVVYFETRDVASAAYTEIGTCTPTLTSRFDITQGHCYWIPSGTFHRTRHVSDEAITLFVRGPFLRKFSLIVDENGPAQYASTRSEVAPAALAEMSHALRGFVDEGYLRSITVAGPDDGPGAGAPSTWR